MTLGLGRAAVVRVAADDASRWTPERSTRRSRRIAPPAAGRSRSWRRSARPRRPSVDPVAAIADDRRARGPVAPRRCGLRRRRSRCCPDRRAPFAGWERADSIVVNPHKWLFTPLDASLLLTRRMDVAARRLQPRARSTCGRSTATTPVHDYNEYPPQLGRRFRALKLWMQLRWFGLEGLRRRIEAHLAMAARFAALGRRRRRTGSGSRRSRSRPSASAGGRPRCDRDEAALDARNAAIMDAVNRTGEVFLSHTRLRGRFTIRLAVGNLRTEPRHVERAWDLLHARPPTLYPEDTMNEPITILYFYRTSGAAMTSSWRCSGATTGRS